MIAKVTPNTNNLVNMPIIPMRGVVVFPNTINHFDAGRDKTIRALELAFETGSPVFLVSQRDVAVEDPARADIYDYGVVAEVKQLLKFSDNLVKALVECRYRGKLATMYDEGDYLSGDILRAPAKALRAADKDEADALMRGIREQIDVYVEHNPKLSEDVVSMALSDANYHKTVEYIAFNMPLDFAEKQQILEQSDLLKRLKLLLELLVKENNVLDLEREISEKVREQIDKNQRDYYIREQIRALSNELGEGGENTVAEADEYRVKLKSLPLEQEQIDKLLKEADRLAQMPGSSQEAAVIRTYLDTIIALPWNVFTEDNYDLKRARDILDRDHYGLEKVKERMLEYLAVRSLTDKINAQIICLIGPPGVGKTSIGRSIAESLDRKFVRMSLGGVRDEAEIRGHRRTYVGAMPGRIISAIQQAGTSNPLVLLDEVDKLGNDYRGDPASALLEVLDPEQNASFRDHFLDVPFDLSNVLFITTANDPSTIPRPLLDRMEVIELSSYTRQEKFKIAKLHLVKKQIAKHGLKPGQVSITDKAIMSIIDNYTREAGVRSLEREIAKVMRKAAFMIVDGEAEKVKIDHNTLDEMLGVGLTRGSLASHKTQVGVVNGLAWTSVGGEIMPIEVGVVPGTGKIELTGSLGDVMKESAKLALSYARSLRGRFKIPEDFTAKHDLHIHAPEGAVPKDGPSAGVALTVAVLSAITGNPVRKDIAMTGEITLKGNVIAIGGLKEKLIAAYKEKMSTVMIPKDNVKDLADIPDEVKSALEIIPIDRVGEALDIALELKGEKTPASSKGVGVKPIPRRSSGGAATTRS